MVGSTRKKLRGKRQRFEGDQLLVVQEGEPSFFFFLSLPLQQRSNWAQDARPNVQSRACEWTMGDGLHL